MYAAGQSSVWAGGMVTEAARLCTVTATSALLPAASTGQAAAVLFCGARKIERFLDACATLAS